MALDWRKSLKTVAESKEFQNVKSGPAALTPAQRLGKNMDKALAAFKAGNKEVKRPTIVKKGDEVKFSVRYSNSPMKLTAEETEVVVPAKEFEAIYAAIKESALAGEFDAQLASLSANAKTRGQTGAASRKANAAKKK
ncbi:hypothetical protein [Sphingobium baderi]|nr:hypothetical protein [Sphingobium baderi]